MSATSAETIGITTNSVLNVNMSNVTKLNSSNYLMWSLQVHALLDGYDLAGYLDGSVQPPASTLTVADAHAVNPAYTLWKRQDKLIYSGLIGAISLSIQPIVSRSQTAADIWKTLAATYAKPSRSHLKQIKHQLKQWTKGTRSIDEYMQGHPSLSILKNIISKFSLPYSNSARPSQLCTDCAINKATNYLSLRPPLFPQGLYNTYLLTFGHLQFCPLTTTNITLC